MHVTVTAKGPTLEALTRDTLTDLRAGARTAGRQIAKVGSKAMETGAPVMWGKRLKVKADPRTSLGAMTTVEFYPAAGSAGGWAIQESGRRGGYEIAPRRARALQFGAGFYAAHALGGAWAGRQAWTAAGARLAAVLDREMVQIFDDAMGV